MLRSGDTRGAERICLSVLERDPDQSDALGLLSEIRNGGGASGAAEVLARRRVLLEPNNAPAAIALALILLDKGALDEAERHARDAIRLAPVNSQAHNVLAMVLTEAQKLNAGEFHYRRVLDLVETPDPILLANLAWNLKQQGRTEEARKLYHESVALAPDIRQTLLGWARLEEADRQFEAAASILDRAQGLHAGDPSLATLRAVILRRTGHPQAALAVVERLETSSSDGLAAEALTEKGTILDRLGRFDEAFTAFAESKRKLRELTGERYQRDQAESMAQSLRNFFTARRLSILPRAGIRNNGAQPVFILGFPRSGTTLVEQMLSAHSAISAGDELPLIADAARLVPSLLESPLAYPDALAELWMAEHHNDLDRLRDRYLRRAAELGAVQPGARWFTDKMPLNETHAGLIHLMFPQAPMVHLIRHPLDAVLSAFFTHMTHGYLCATDLESAARHYVLTMDLMEHYRREMPLNYLAVRYESILEDPEGNLRQILALIGAPFEPACLRFQENPRLARTPSYAQVAEPLYTRARGRYRNYLRHLAPVIPILQPVMERLGYAVA